MEENLVVVKINGKAVKIPQEMKDNNRRLSARAFAVETGQATWEEMNGEPAVHATANGNVDAAMIGAGRTASNLYSNAKQGIAGMFDNQSARDVVDQEIGNQNETDRLSQGVKSDFPVSSFLGEQLPYFAVPGGKAAQLGAGAVTGALEGDTLGERLGGAALGLGAGYLGQKGGDWVGARVQNVLQRARGAPNALARRELLRAGIPLSISQRTDGAVSKPLARFFERAKFVLTGRQPNAAAQQSGLTKMVTEALGTNDKVLTREALGRAVESNRKVFKTAASRVVGKLDADAELTKTATGIIDEFNRVGSDSGQVTKIFSEFEDFITSPDGLDPDLFLKLRSNLSEATTKSDIETSALVDAIRSLDDRLARSVPALADELVVARDRFRLLLAIRRGSALNPQGEINVNTFTNNLQRVFKDFDVGKPLPRGLRNAGEAIAGFNQVSNGFRSSGTAENAMAGAVPGLGAATDPGLALRILSGAAVPFAGGGTGGLLGGGGARSITQSLLDVARDDRQ